MSKHLIPLVFLMAASISARAETPLSESAAETLHGFVLENVDKLPTPVLVVMPFRNENGAKSMEGELIAERLITELSVEPKLKIVERQHLDKALAEQQLALEGFVSPESAAQAGRLTGAGAVLTATLTPMGENVEIHARLFSVESGEVLGATRVNARRTIRSFINPLWDDIDAVKSKGRPFKARVWTDKDRLDIGDEAVVCFEVDQPCHVTVFDYSTDGSITVLFPNRFQPDNRARPDRIYRIPAEEGGYRIRVQGPPGLEQLKLFATTEDVPLYVRDYSQAPFNSMEDGDSVRGLVATLEEMPEMGWAEASWEFLVTRVLR